MAEIPQSATFIHGVYINTDYSDGTCLRYDSATGRFTHWTPNHNDLSNNGTTTHANLDTHYADDTIHFTEASIDHTAITNIGTNTHAQIDTAVTNSTNHIAAANPHSGSASSSDLTTHTSAAAPHSGHEATANKGSASGYCGLDGSGLVDGDDLPAPTTSKKGGVPALETSGTLFLYRDGSWQEPPGASGGEANTASNQGGGQGVYKQKTAVDLELYTLNSTQFTQASDIIEFVVAAPGPDYTPPAIKYKDADEITVPAGVYYPLGDRLDGQYQVQNYVPWTVGSAFDIDVDLAGNLIGGDVVSSWYSIFLTSASTAIVLPFIRVDAIDYNVSHALKTTINPADHNDGTTANDNFVSAADVFNTYRLRLLNKGTYHGTVFTIEDSVDGTPDEIIIDGDVSSQIAATEWLQMIPPSGTDCLYLGCIRLDGSGDLEWFQKNKWTYKFSDLTTKGIYLNSATSAGNTDLGSMISPTAFIIFGTLLLAKSSACYGGVIKFYRGDSGTDQTHAHKWSSAISKTAFTANGLFNEILTVPAKIRNYAATINTSSAEEATLDDYRLGIQGCEE